MDNIITDIPALEQEFSLYRLSNSHPHRHQPTSHLLIAALKRSHTTTGS